MKLVYLNGPYQGQPYSRSSRSPAVTKSGTLYYPLGLSYAAGYALQETDHAVYLIDAVAQKIGRAQLADSLAAIRPDVVFCETSTPSIYEDLNTAMVLRERVPDCRIVMVGTHASAVPEQVLQCDAVDAVALGEYDETAIALVRALEDGRDLSQVSGLALPGGDGIIRTAERALIADLDRLPFVSQVYAEHLNPESYFFAAAQYPMVMIQTSRGCPHRCQWCLYPQVMHRGKYRQRSAANVVEEFAWIAENLPAVREVGIEDDLFTGDKRRLRDICRRLIESGNQLNFWCDTRVDLDLDTMILMREAGCRLLIAGFESASQTVLDRIGKGTQVEQAYEFVRNARQADLLVHGCFVLGNPGETRQDMQATLDFAKKLDPDTVQFFPMIVYPGTSMYDWARNEGYLRTEDYRQWLTPEGLHDSVIDLPGLPGEEVRRFCDHARCEFYLRRGYIIKKMAQSMTDFHEARRNFKAFFRLARHLTSTS